MKGFQIHKTLILVLSSLFLFSCNWFGSRKEKDEKAIARVYDKYLYESEVMDMLPAKISKEDSLSFVKNYIQKWIKEELELHRAELNLTEEQKDFEEQLENYRKSLILFQYEKEIVRQNLDTAVSNERIQEYYDKNQRNFELKENIVKAIFVKVNKNAPKIGELREWYKSTDSEELEKLKEYCLQFSTQFNLGDKWVPLDKIVNQMPLQVDNQLQFIQRKPAVEREDSLHYYFLNIKEYKTRDSISPLSFERENIRNIILNQRKLKLINNMKQELYETALKKNKIETY